MAKGSGAVRHQGQGQQRGKGQAATRYRRDAAGSSIQGAPTSRGGSSAWLPADKVLAPLLSPQLLAQLSAAGDAGGMSARDL